MTVYSFLFLTHFFLFNSSDTLKSDDPIPGHETFTLKSKYLDETRTINIWTPLEYQLNNDSLPVLYMPDGGIKEDFPHIANTLAELIKSKKIPPIILVGIENTKRQRDLTGPTEVENDKKIADEIGGSANFRAFILEEIVPIINETHRTTAQRGLIGESLAGLFVMETFLLKPTDFNFYIAFDPSLWWNGHFYDENVKNYLAKFPDQKTTIWFASSSAKGMSKATHKIARALKKMPDNKVTFNYSNEPKEKHNTIFRATKEKAIIWTLNAL